MTTWGVLWRELRAMVCLPQTYAIGAAFLALSGFFFLTFFSGGGLPDLEQYYSNIASTLIVLVPIVAMRSFAEERRSGALDVTLSWPLSRVALVAGKYVANVAFTWVLLSVAWLYVRLLTGLGQVEVGKAAAGYVGILLLAAALHALALAVSARTSSPTTAAFLGFGVLLGLWSLQYAPGSLGPLGKRLASLAPSTHLEAGARGVVDGSDVAYFLICVAVGLALAIHSLDRQRSGRAVRVQRRRNVRFAGLAVVAALLLGVAPRVEAQTDLTPTKRYTVTRKTLEIARRVHSPVRVTGFVDPESALAVKLRELVRQYRVAHVPVQLEIVDPDEQPALARERGVTAYGQMLVEIGGRSELVNDLGQIPLTSAILRLSRGEPLLACFTIGHGEPALDDEGPGGFRFLDAALRRLGYDTAPLALAGPGGPARLGGCDVVVTSPRIPFLDSEVALLADHLRAKGRLLVLAAREDGPLPQLNTLLRPWGLALGQGVVRDRSSLADDPSAIVSSRYPSASPATQLLKRDNIPAVLIQPRPVEGASGQQAGASIAPLITSSSHSAVDGAGEGPFVLAAQADWSQLVTGPDPDINRTRISVLGSAEAATNRFFDTFGNRDLVSGLVQWTAREDDVIAAAREYGGVRKILLTGPQRRDLVRAAIVLPALAWLVPLPVALLRLRRG
jgi:ABC-type transport system involved in cytochrome c biogenesis permease component